MCFLPSSHPHPHPPQPPLAARREHDILQLKNVFSEDLDPENDTIIYGGVCLNIEGIYRYMNRNRLHMTSANAFISVFHIIMMSYMRDIMEMSKIHFFDKVTNEEYETFLNETELLYETIACHQLIVTNLNQEIALNLSWKYGAKVVMLRDDHSQLAYHLMEIIDDLMSSFDMSESDECIRNGNLQLSTS